MSAAVADPTPVGVLAVTWNNLVPGWQAHCICGFVTFAPAESLVDAAQDMEDHWQAAHEWSPR